MALKIVITDDEPGILLILNNVLTGIRDVIIVGEASTGKDTEELVKRLNPDVVFLDIDLPDILGIKLAAELLAVKPNLYIVFVTAHDDYMYEAIKLYSYDYILKPIEGERVKETVLRIQNDLLLKNDGIQEKNGFTLPFKDKDATIFIETMSIFYFEKAGKRVLAHCSKGKFETKETLRELEEKLGDPFFRSHKSFLINISKIEGIVKLNKGTSYQVRFKNFLGEAFLSRKAVHALYNKMQEKASSFRKD